MNRTHALNRRTFIKTVGLAGAAIGAGTRALRAQAPAAAPPQARDGMPTRPFGRTGFDVSILGMGGMFDIPNNQIVLHQALDNGVTYWDTADCYNGGKSEEGIGIFFTRNPGAREKVFLVTKSDKRDPAGMTELMHRSLERMKTDVIDLYFLHGIRGIDELNDDTRAWAERAKADGKIKLFGFSTHGNMEDCLLGAAPLGWIDGIMVKIDSRLMQRERMHAAVEACHRAGIGLTAMKTQGGRVSNEDTGKVAELMRGLMARGFTDKQTNLKAVWEDTRIASICSQMPNVTILKANVAAALDRTELSAEDRRLLGAYARETERSYCAGCSRLCEGAVAGGLPVSDVMRCLMYHRDYGDVALARDVFGRIDAPRRAALAGADYRAAERRCPQGLPIARLMREAAELLT